MFRIEFVSSMRDNDPDGRSTNINLCYEFPDQPSWDQLCEPFMEFLKANGYQFNTEAKVDVLNSGAGALHDDEEDYPFDFAEPEDEPVKKAKGGKKKK